MQGKPDNKHWRALINKDYKARNHYSQDNIKKVRGKGEIIHTNPEVKALVNKLIV